MTEGCIKTWRLTTASFHAVQGTITPFNAASPTINSKLPPSWQDFAQTARLIA